jgi:hypothetical protein
VPGPNSREASFKEGDFITSPGSEGWGARGAGAARDQIRRPHANESTRPAIVAFHLRQNAGTGRCVRRWAMAPIQNGEGSLTEKFVTALCLAIVLAVLFGGPMVGKGGRLWGDPGRVAQLGH